MSKLVQTVLVISHSGRRSGISFPQMGSVKQSRAGLNSPKGRKEACSELINIPVSFQDKRLTPLLPHQELLTGRCLRISGCFRAYEIGL